MSKPTMKQLCELFGQIAEGKITDRTIQELIEGPSKSQIFKKNVLQIRTKAAEAFDIHERGLTLCGLVSTLAKVGDFEEAREVVTEITHKFHRISALEIIASFSHKAEDKRQAKAAKQAGDPNAYPPALWC